MIIVLWHVGTPPWHNTTHISKTLSPRSIPHPSDILCSFGYCCKETCTRRSKNAWFYQPLDLGSKNHGFREFSSENSWSRGFSEGDHIAPNQPSRQNIHFLMPLQNSCCKICTSTCAGFNWKLSNPVGFPLPLQKSTSQFCTWTSAVTLKNLWFRKCSFEICESPTHKFVSWTSARGARNLNSEDCQQFRSKNSELSSCRCAQWPIAKWKWMNPSNICACLENMCNCVILWRFLDHVYLLRKSE